MDFNEIYDIKPYDLRIEAELIRIVDVVTFGERTKTVFEAEIKKGEPTTCIFWGRTKAQAGDMLILTGFMNGKRFIVKRLLYESKAKRA